MHRHWLALGFSFVLTAVTLFFVFRGIDRQTFARLLATQDRGWLAVAAVFLLTQIFLGGERWRSILCALMRGPLPSVASVQAVFYASIFFNCLPLGTVGGDVARVWLARRFAVSLSQIVLSILVDRVLTVAALIMLALATLPTISSPLAVTAWFGGAAILVAGLLGVLLLGIIERVLGRWRRQRLIHFVLRMAEELGDVTTRAGLRALGFALASRTCLHALPDVAADVIETKVAALFDAHHHNFAVYFRGEDRRAARHYGRADDGASGSRTALIRH